MARVRILFHQCRQLDKEGFVWPAIIRLLLKNKNNDGSQLLSSSNYSLPGQVTVSLHRPMGPVQFLSS